MSVQTQNDLGDWGECWCCGEEVDPSETVSLGRHPEVTLCLRCAHDVHKRAVAKEDAERTSVTARTRDVMRAGRHWVIEQGLPRKPIIGPPLRWLGRYLP
jgi:ribosome-binding protein aMBF1 (putative translation factor)